MLHVLHTVGHHESKDQDAIWLFQSTFNRNSRHSSLSTVQHNSSNFLNQIWTSMQLSQWVLSPHCITSEDFFSRPPSQTATKSHRKQKRTLKIVSVPPSHGRTDRLPLFSGTGMNLSSHMRESFFFFDEVVKGRLTA